MKDPLLKYIELNVEESVAFAQLNRPAKANAFDEGLWFEIGRLADWASEEKTVRALVLSGNGKNFTAGIDFQYVMEIQKTYYSLAEPNRGEFLRQYIKKMQDSFNALRECSKPVIAAIHGACIGGGVDLITACDMRYSTEDASFSVKEIDLGIVADIGTLQRLPLLIGEGMTRELSFTGRHFSGKEAKEMGLVNSCFQDENRLMKSVQSMAFDISKKSPSTVRGIKKVLNFNQDRLLQEGLDFVANWNSTQLFTEDSKEAMTAVLEKREPQFKD